MNIFQQIRNDPKFNTTNSYRWFQSVVGQVAGGMTGNAVLSEQGVKFVTIPSPGQLYIFKYDPKYKDTLPVWDRFPLLLPFDLSPKHFMGLNLHYLGVQERFAVFQKLMDIASTYNGAINNDKLRIYSWNFLKQIAMAKQVAPCVKKYLKSHVRSRFLRIPPKDWLTSILLPVEEMHYK